MLWHSFIVKGLLIFNDIEMKKTAKPPAGFCLCWDSFVLLRNTQQQRPKYTDVWISTSVLVSIHECSPLTKYRVSFFKSYRMFILANGLIQWLHFHWFHAAFQLKRETVREQHTLCVFVWWKLWVGRKQWSSKITATHPLLLWAWWQLLLLMCVRRLMRIWCRRTWLLSLFSPLRLLLGVIK